MRRDMLTAAMAALALLAGCSGTGAPTSGPRDAPRDLGRSEVREYQGADLSSVGEFRENSISGPQQVDEKAYRLVVGGLVSRPMTLTYAEVLGRPSHRKVVRLDCVEGWSVDILWEGVRVDELIGEAGPATSADTVVFRAADGYSTSLPLAYLRENSILMAHHMNGLVLPPERGFPFQLVAEDKWGYKWVKWIEAIEVTDDPAYRGYWEQRGYSNTGDRSKGPFDE